MKYTVELQKTHVLDYESVSTVTPLAGGLKRGVKRCNVILIINLFTLRLWGRQVLHGELQ